MKQDPHAERFLEYRCGKYRPEKYISKYKEMLERRKHYKYTSVEEAAKALD